MLAAITAACYGTEELTLGRYFSACYRTRYKIELSKLKHTKTLQPLYLITLLKNIKTRDSAVINGKLIKMLIYYVQEIESHIVYFF